MIPKIIHYSWISNDPHPPMIKRCMASWKKYAPDYEMVHWDKARFDIRSLKFTQQAYDCKKWAFISDVQRLYALYHFGGIYLDSDVELVKSLDDLLSAQAFIGHEIDSELSMGVIASEKGHPWIKMLLDYYKDRSFFLPNGELDIKPNTDIVTELTERYYSVTIADQPRSLNGEVTIYSQRYFSPPIIFTGFAEVSQETYAIHHFAGSWKPTHIQRRQRLRRYVHFIKYILRKVLGKYLFNRLISAKRRILPWFNA